MTGLTLARLDGDGLALRSRTFDDIYFQPDLGLEESQHVFIAGSGIDRRIAALAPGDNIAVGELGFGTGLNVLALAQAFEAAAPGAHLHVFSVEAHPLPQDRLRRVMEELAARWPVLAPHTQRLAAVYPDPRPGWWHTRFSDRLTLTVAFGPALEAVRGLTGTVDAWFLDGFAPDRNPDMWSPDLLSAVAAHLAPGGTAASFTVAGAVRRALGAAGLSVDKRPGFGRKREQLFAAAPGAWAPRRAGRVAVVGAGIGGVMAAHHLRRIGATVTLLDANGPGHGASGNPAGLVMPRIEAADRLEARFYRDAYRYARAFYEDVTPQHIRHRGGQRPARTDADRERHGKVLATGLWAPDDLVGDPDDALLAPGALCIDPGAIVRTLAEESGWERASVASVAPGPEGSTLRSVDGPIGRGDPIVLTAGPGLVRLCPALAPDVSASRGQIDWFAGPPPPGIVSAGAYAAPLGDAAAGLVLGATYDAAGLEDAPAPDAASTEQNRRAGEALLNRPLPATDWTGARAALRAVTRDRHPLCGDTEEGVYVLGGLGSRGLVTAPLLAASVAAAVVNGPGPLDRETAALLSPGRFARRRARRGDSGS